MWLDTIVFHVQLVAINTDESVTRVHTVRITKEEANLAARPEKSLDLSFIYLFYLFISI